jgi:hypothetical protein
LTLKTAETMLFSLYKGAIDKNHNSYHRSMQQQTGTNTQRANNHNQSATRKTNQTQKSTTKTTHKKK